MRATSSASIPAAWNIELLALRHERVPDFHRIVPRHPDFVAQVAGVSGARNVHGHAGDLSARHRKYFRLAMSASATAFSSFAEVGPCSASAADLLGNVFDLHIHAQTVLLEPAQARIGGRPAIDFSSSRVIVPSSMTLPSSSHQQQ